MLTTTQFLELFRRENYAVTMALNEEKQLDNVMDSVLAKRTIEGVHDKEYSMVPMGELSGRNEAEPIAQSNMSMGYTCYGAIAIEASRKVGLSKEMKLKAKALTPAGGTDEPKLAGYIADTVGRAFQVRWAQRQRKLAARIFNYGGIQAGHNFFNPRLRCKLSDVPNTGLIYDASPLFARPAAVHHSFAANATLGTGSSPVGNFIDYAMTIADTGGYFNAFDLPPAYWALKRVVNHYINNMQFDENDEAEEGAPDTLLVSAHNYTTWLEILKSKFIEPIAAGSTTNIENIFGMSAVVEGFNLRLVPSRDLVRNTWFVGKAKSQGILILEPKSSETDDPFAYWKNEEDRTYWISYEREWGLMIRNWRKWCAGAISLDGTTAPTFGGIAETAWNTMPTGI